MSYIELAGETVTDLLRGQGSHRILDLREGAGGAVSVPGMTTKVVSSSQSILSLKKLGDALRRTASHALNSCSSRSHTVIQIECRRDGVDVLDFTGLP